MEYEQWISEVSDITGMDPVDLEEAYPNLRSLLFDAGASAKEAADYLAT